MKEPMPEGYFAVHATKIDAVGYQPEGHRALIWLTAPDDLKVCLAVPIDALVLALNQIMFDHVAKQPQSPPRDAAHTLQ